MILLTRSGIFNYGFICGPILKNSHRIESGSERIPRSLASG